MGVLACDRLGCENIMCNRSSKKYYICDECFDELVALGSTTDIEEFMEENRKQDRAEAYARFNQVFQMKD